MKLNLGGVFLALALVLAGCDDVADRLSGPVIQQPPQVRVFPADERTVFAAAKAALDTMNYRITRGGPAQGQLEAVGEIVPGDAPDSTKQTTIKAEFHPSPDGGTEVDVSVVELVQEDTGNRTAGPAATPGTFASASVPESPLADTFLRAILQNLSAK